MDGWYYLHSETKDLIYKRFEPEADSPFVLRVWRIDVSNRLHAWTICIEALALGALVERIKELAMKWGLIPEDALDYMARAEEPTPEKTSALLLFMSKIHGIDEDAFWTMMERDAEKRKAG